MKLKSLLALGAFTGTRSAVTLAVALSALFGGRTSKAANANWTGGSVANANWSTAGNWSAAAPGTTNTATFNAAIANTWGSTDLIPIVIDTAGGISLKSILFTTASGNYFIGSTAGNKIKLEDAGAITISSALTNPVSAVVTETVNAPLELQGTTYTFTNSSANGTVAKAGILKIGGAISGVNVAATTLTLNGANTNANTISGAISNGSAPSLGISKSGAGIWILSGANSYTGTTAINVGTLTADIANGVGTGALGNGGDITFGGGTLQYTANSATSDYSARFKNSTTGAIKLDTNGQSVTLGSAIASSNTGGLTKTGLGTLTLSVANSYSGTTTITQGAISLASFDRLGTSTSDIITGGSGAGLTSSLIYTGTGETVTRNIAPSNNNLFTLTQSGASGTLIYAGGFLTGSAFNRTLVLDGTGTAEFSGVIDNGDATRNTTLTKNGTGTWSLTGANLHRAATNVNQGTLTVSGSGTLGATTGVLNVNNTNTTAPGTNTVLNLSTTLDTTKGNLSGTISNPLSGTNTATINNGGAGRNFTINQTTAATFAGVIAGGGDFTLGSLSTNKLTLSGTNTYTGNTTVNAGTLAIDGSISTSLLTTVNSGGTLGGVGTVGAATVAAGGILAPGNSIGTLNFSDTLSLAGISNFEIDPTLGVGVNADRANVTNGVIYGGTLNVLYAGLNTNFAAGMIFNLFDASSFANSFGTVNLPSLTGGLSWQNDLITNGSLTVVPEPNAAMLIGSLGMLALLRRRRA